MTDDSRNSAAPSTSPHWWRRLLVEPDGLAGVVRSPSAHWFVVGTVCIGAFMGQLDASVVTLALPTLRSDLGVGLGAVEWVALSYLLVLVALVTLVGRLADMLGRKLLYTYGFGVFVLGSALCGLAPSLAALIAARVLQGVGAAMLQANSVALIVHAMPRDRLGRGIGLQGAAQALGLAAGPMVGGALIALGGWRLIFLINVPAGIVGMVLGWCLLPRSTGLTGWRGFDWVGVACFVPAVGALMGALSLGHDRGLTSPVPLALMCTGLILFGVFAARESRARSPLVDLRLFHQIRFSAGVASGLLSYLVLFGVLFLVPFYLELRRHMDAAQAGITLSALPLALGAVAPLAGRLADRIGARWLTVGGMVLTTVALSCLAVLHEGPALVVELACIGAGMGAFTPANSASVMSSAPRGHAGVAGGILNMTRGVGTSLGVAVTGLVYGIAGGVSVARRVPSPGQAVRQGFLAATLFLAIVAVGAGLLAAMRAQPLSPAFAVAGGTAAGGVVPPRSVSRPAVRWRPAAARDAERERSAQWALRELSLAAAWVVAYGVLLAVLGVAGWHGEAPPHPVLRFMVCIGTVSAILGLCLALTGLVRLVLVCARLGRSTVAPVAALAVVVLAIVALSLGTVVTARPLFGAAPAASSVRPATLAAPGAG